MKKALMIITAFAATFAQAQITPDISSWIRNTTGATGYNGIPSNVQIVQYSANNVYVSCTCIPSYNIGPWPGNPNIASNQNYVFKITRNPQQNTGTPVAIGLGHIGVWTNGVSIYNVSDAQSYMNQGIWNRNAYYWEGQGFDNCLGHPQQQGEYHHHVSPQCLYNEADSTVHSPVIGYAFDGFPVYGAYGYADPSGTGGIKRMASSYVLSAATTRVNGPAVSAQYPAGCFIEDYIYTPGSGDLDERNGRYCVTPDYPNGTYAYFVTIDAALTPVFPYTFFGTYYGTVQAGNTGPGSGHNSISEPTTIYNGTTSVIENSDIRYTIVPNPVSDHAYIYIDASSSNNLSAIIYDARGTAVRHLDYLQPSIGYAVDMTDFPAGNYFIHISDSRNTVIEQIVKIK
jgi:hypothetical protein